MEYYNPLEKIYKFEAPNKLIFGNGSLGKIVDELKVLKYKKILLITDKVIRKNEVIENLIFKLQSNKYEIKIFETAVKEPTVEMVNSCVDFVRSEGEGIIIGIGGGSVIDQSKIASVMVRNNGKIEDYVGADKIDKKGLPLILVPTTAGTGSEVSKNAVFYSKKGMLVITSPKIFSSLSIVDPLITLSLPPFVTAYSGMDALSHSIEGIMSLNCNDIVMPIALESVSLINYNLPISYLNGKDIQSRYKMCLAATLGGLALNGGCVLAHSIAYTLDFLKIPHGLACAIALPFVMKFNAPVIPHKMYRIAKALGLSDCGSVNNNIKISSYAINSVKKLNTLLNIPLSLESMGVTKEKAIELASDCFNKYPRPNNPRRYSKDDLEKLYTDLWSGDLTIE
jgi:alcohol dehydrogenase class IV